MRRYRLVYNLAKKHRKTAHERMARYGYWERDWWTPALSQMDDPQRRIQREGYTIIATDYEEEKMASKVLVRTEVWAVRSNETNIYHLNIEIDNQGDPANDINEESVVEEIKAILVKWATSWLKYEDIQVALTTMEGGQMKK